MSLTLQDLNNIRTLRAMAREFSIGQLEEILEKFSIVTEERREEERVRQQEIAEREEKLKAWVELIQADGIDPNEVVKELNGAPRKKRVARPAKYRYIDLDGSEKTWTGQGRTPKAIAQATESGKSLEDFLI
ncbi:H-NS histone family protein [Erwinia sp. CPCC 100877]|nr:H-NS histone family protein [Erwinia sp. CPCC 100877]